MTLDRDDFLSFDGVRIAFHTLGEGRPIILLHGLFSNGVTNWSRYGAATEIAGAGYRVILPDFRAHGDSSAPHEASHYPPDILAMDVEALIRHLEPGNFVLGGYSLGARTAVRLLARGLKPDRVILGGMGLSGITGGTERAQFFLDVLAAPDSFASGTAGYYAAQFLKQNKIDAIAAAHVLRSQLGTPLDVVRGMETPALVICGAGDQDNGSAAELADALPNASLVTIPGNHMSAVTKPDFGAAIAAWLEHRV
jgi:pimeloyl-ACP methyl ester carboxylesterase